MPHSSATSELATLQECWRQWTCVVEFYATKNSTRQPIDESNYRRMHNRLLQACRSLAEQADPVRRSHYEFMEELAKPWMTPRILGRTNSHFLADLLALCRQAEEQLTGRQQTHSWKRWLLFTALFLVLGVIGALIAIGLHTGVRLWHLHIGPAQQGR